MSITDTVHGSVFSHVVEVVIEMPNLHQSDHYTETSTLILHFKGSMIKLMYRHFMKINTGNSTWLNRFLCEPQSIWTLSFDLFIKRFESNRMFEKRQRKSEIKDSLIVLIDTIQEESNFFYHSFKLIAWRSQILRKEWSEISNGVHKTLHWNIIMVGIRSGCVRPKYLLW